MAQKGKSMSVQEQPEVWLRGRVEGFDPMLMPVVHALLQVQEDLERLAASVLPAQLWLRPGGAAAIGFHIRHLGGALDRLFTYARGERLSDAQKRFLRAEEEPGEPPATMTEVMADTMGKLERAFEQLRLTTASALLDERRVGRAELPSNVLGLLFHAAEHSTRHMGQAISTARILSGRTAG